MYSLPFMYVDVDVDEDLYNSRFFPFVYFVPVQQHIIALLYSIMNILMSRP